MIKSDEIKGPSCLTNATDDEPVFVLRANDELAPDIVRLWAAMYKHQKQAACRNGLNYDQIAKHKEALNLADQMDHWLWHKLGLI